jgi:hypothetical protein
MTATEIAKELNIDKATLSRWLKREGCPPLSAGAAAIAKWRHDGTMLDRGPKMNLFDEDDCEDDGALSLEWLGYELPEGDDIDALLARNQEREKILFAKLTAAEKYLATNRNPKLTSRLTQLQTAHIAASKMVAAIMNTRSEMVSRSKTVIPRVEFEEKLLHSITILSMFIMNLSGRIITNPEEKPMLLAIAQSWDLEIAARLLYEFNFNVNAPQWEQEFEKYVAASFRIDYAKLSAYRAAKGFKRSQIQPDEKVAPRDKVEAFQASLNEEQ